MVFDFKKVFNTIPDKISYFIRAFFYIYIFSLPFKHVTSIRETSFYLMLLLFLIKIGKNGIKIKFNDLSIIAFFSLVGAVFVSILFSPYPMDSLDAFRKNMFMQMAVFFVILNEFDSFEKLKPLIFTVVGSFAVLGIVILIEGGVLGRFEFVTEARQHDPKTFWGGYALVATFYIPFTVGCLFIGKDNRAVIGIIFISLLLEIFLLTLYGKRTSLIAVMFSQFVLLLLTRKHKRLLILFFFALTIIGSAYYGSAYYVSRIVKQEISQNEKTLQTESNVKQNEKTVQTESHVKPEIIMPLNDLTSMIERYAMWKGTLDIIKERPVFGYGYGWKKLSWVAKEPRFLNKWASDDEQFGRTKHESSYNYFKHTNYGSANPHNLILQILFEIGIIGLGAFVFFWSTIYIRAIKIFFKAEPSEGKPFVTYGVLGVLMSYIVINITNGLWEETTGMLMTVLAALTLVAFKEQQEISVRYNQLVGSAKNEQI